MHKSMSKYTNLRIIHDKTQPMKYFSVVYDDVGLYVFQKSKSKNYICIWSDFHNFMK